MALSMLARQTRGARAWHRKSREAGRVGIHPPDAGCECPYGMIESRERETDQAVESLAFAATAASFHAPHVGHRMLKLKHLVHPFRTAGIAKMRLLNHLHMRRFASHTDTRFQGDSRYDLQNVTNGFVPRLNDSTGDISLLQRICAAYRKTIEDQRLAAGHCEPTEWWREMRRTALGPVMRALQNGDIGALQTMYKNFFRDPCAAGLVGVPFGMWKACFHGPMKDVHRRTYIGDALYRLDYWTSRTGGSFGLSDLAGPEIGNPFGVLLNGTLVRSGTEYQHYCAHQIRQFRSARCVVAEIGGGYGGLAYYLLRDAQGLTYVDFDVPESIALTSYYLAKAFPSLKFALYGEKELTEETVATSDVVLMPLFEMPRMPAGSVNITVASHVMGDLPPSALEDDMKFVVRSTRNYFLYFGDRHAADAISIFLGKSGNGHGPWETRASDWNRHKAPNVSEVECIYDFTLN